MHRDDAHLFVVLDRHCEDGHRDVGPYHANSYVATAHSCRRIRTTYLTGDEGDDEDLNVIDLTQEDDENVDATMLVEARRR